MVLTVKHLNSDASFLLTFEPIIPEYAQGAVAPQPFTILLDPWITGPSKIFHSKISISTHKHPACISSLAELEHPPDLVIISQHKSDHCNEATLRQLPPTGTKTLILAEPASARLIKSWRYFDKEKIRTIERWEDPRLTGKQSVVRVPVPPLVSGGQAGEVTVAFIPQKRDLAGLHGAIGVTYRPPLAYNLNAPLSTVKFLTPPSTPESQTQTFTNVDIMSPVPTPTNDTFLLPPSPPISPHSLRSVRSASTLVASPTHSNLNSINSNLLRPTSSSRNNNTQYPPISTNGPNRPISLLFSPHGISYDHLAPYATSHLVAEAALPLTALLHCMDSITNPWWLGGNISAGVPIGAEIATSLGARVWISAHDGEKDVRGLATGMLKTRRWEREEIEGAMKPSLRLDKNRGARTWERQRLQSRIGEQSVRKSKSAGTQVLRLNSGEEVNVSGEGMVRCSLGKANDQGAAAATPRDQTQAQGEQENMVRERPTPTPEREQPKVESKKAAQILGVKKASRNGLSVRFKTAGRTKSGHKVSVTTTGRYAPVD